MSKIRLIVIILVVLFGLGLRLWLASTLESDWDEDDYLAPSAYFRRAFDAGDFAAVTDQTLNPEHPPLVKILYAFALDGDELDQFPAVVPRFSREPQPPDSLRNTRLQSVIFGALAIGVTALVSPLGGFALSIQSIHAHFSSVAYLDALPVLMTALCAFLYTAAGSSKQHRWLYLLLSGVCLGVAVACKYPYAVMGVAVALHLLFNPVKPAESSWLITLRQRVMRLVGWGSVALLTFFLCNPFLWSDPIGRVMWQLTYFRDYAEDRLPDYRPLRPLEQLYTPREHLRHLLPETQFAPLTITDPLLFVLAIPGALILLRRGTVYGWWLVIGLAFLMLWPTQWIQHKMLIVMPYSLAAAATLETAVQYARGRLNTPARAPQA